MRDVRLALEQGDVEVGVEFAGEYRRRVPTVQRPERAVARVPFGALSSAGDRAARA